MISKKFNAFLSVFTLLVMLTDPESCAESTPETVPPGASASATPPRAALPARFQATVYEVQTTTEQAGGFDGKLLTAVAETPETLLKALSEKGTPRILYRIDQPVDVASERIAINSEEPVVTGTRLMANGQSINTVSYQNVGVLIQLSTRDQVRTPVPEVSLSIEVKTLTESDKELSRGVTMPTTRSLAIIHAEPLNLEKPSVALCVLSASPKDGASPVAYVIRYRFSAAASPAPGPGHAINITREFFATLSSEDFDHASRLVVPGRYPKERLKKLQESLRVEEAELREAYVGREQAAVITAETAPRQEGSGRTGRWGISLRREGDGWLVRDMDFPPNKQALEKYLVEFRNVEPDAQKAITP